MQDIFFAFRKIKQMRSIETFVTLPTLTEFLIEIKEIISSCQRPAHEILLDDKNLCKFLQISPRHAANLRAKREITFSKAGGKIYYRLSDVLDFIKKHEVTAISLQNRFTKNK